MSATPSSIALPALFGRFLRFGATAWGGPVAQIATLRDELVDGERWIPPERFNRVLAVYQALPGPEAHEMCVYFGMVARGRIGGFLAGLGFMLPGFVLMLGLSWMYVRWGMKTPILLAVFAGCQPAVVALIVRGLTRIGSHALHDRALWGIALAAGACTLGGISFLIALPVSGLVYAFHARMTRQSTLAALATTPWAFLVQAGPATLVPTTLGLLGSGLRCGLLTFGGAYTAIPFLQHDAVVRGGWMTNGQFLDGIALAGILPAPLIIFSTFVGYVGGGMPGALAITLGVFAPAFAFTLVGHSTLERLVDHVPSHAFLDGVTAGVVGVMAATAWHLLREVVTGPAPLMIFAGALVLAFTWRIRLAVVYIMALAAMVGALITLPAS